MHHELNELIGHLFTEREASRRDQAEVAMIIVQLERQAAAQAVLLERLKTHLTGITSGGRET